MRRRSAKGLTYRTSKGQTMTDTDTTVRTESQRSITDWAFAAFGECTDTLRAFERCREEISEFESSLGPDEWLAEMADVVITFNWFASILNRNLQQAVDAKMAVNRARRWHTRGDGTGYHVKE